MVNVSSQGLTLLFLSISIAGASAWASYYSLDENCARPLEVDEHVMGAHAVDASATRVLHVDGAPCGALPQQRATGSTVRIALGTPPEGTRYAEHVIDASGGALDADDAGHTVSCVGRRAVGEWRVRRAAVGAEEGEAASAAAAAPSLRWHAPRNASTVVLTHAWAARYGAIQIGPPCVIEITPDEESTEL